jgi:peptide/nickel transport system permease protein
MIPYIARRLLLGVLTLVSLCVVTFTFLYAGAAGTARNIVGETASQVIVNRKIAELGLNRPLATQFFEWAGRALTGNLGRSWFTGQPVTDAIATRLPVTLSLTIGTIVISGIVGIVIGAISASRRGWTDRVIQVVAVAASAVPSFIVALALVLIFAIQLRWFPATGYVTPQDSVSGWLSTVTLPIIALSIAVVASVLQQVRGSMIDNLRLDYVRTLRARGLPEWRVMYRHVLRNAAGPALSMLGLQFVVVFGAAVVVEQLFSLPGIGQTVVVATGQGDIPLVMGVVIVTGILVVVVNLLVDLLQAWLNPKVRLG